MDTIAPSESVLSALQACPYEALFVTVSGAHLYGFESADSDWDLRGAFVAPLEEVVGLSPAPETHEVLDKDAQPEIDIVLHEARKYFRMLLKNNGYVLEQVYSPLVVSTSVWFEELKQIASRCISRRHRFHFFRFGQDQWKATTGSDRPTVKGLLYTYRPLMAGIHLMETGEVESNLRVLNKRFGVAAVDELIDRKLAGEERMGVTTRELDLHRPIVDELCQKLHDAQEWSTLPEEPGGHAEMNDLLLRIRTS